jgi:glycosyltransferase involved in cell wall biosynthesis
MVLSVLYVGMLPPFEGGSAISMSEILRGLAARGHTVRAVAPITPETMAQGVAFAEAYPSIALTRYLVPWFNSGPDRPEPEPYCAAHTAQLERLLPVLFDQERPDVILLGRETFAWYVTEQFHEWGIPIVQRLAGSTINGLLAGTFPEPQASQMRRVLRKAHARVAAGRQLALAAERLGIGTVSAIPTGIDLDRFQPRAKDPALLQRLDIAPESVVVAHASNLKSVKRPLDLVHSAATILATAPNVVYLVVGHGPLRQAMEDACRDAGLTGRFRFVGWRPYEQMHDYVNLADMVVSPSEMEGLSRAYLETQACGRVLIASDIPAACEIVRHGETGLLFPCGDVDALSEATLVAARDPALRAAIGRKARRQAETRSIADTVADYERVLTHVARQARLGAPSA